MNILSKSKFNSRNSFVKYLFLVLVVLFFVSCDQKRDNNDLRNEEKLIYTRSKSGKILIRGMLRNDLKEGLWIFYKDSVAFCATTYKNGIENGPTMMWTEDGDFEEVGRMLNGKKDGYWKEYQASGGHLVAEGCYLQDNRVGVWKRYNDEGTGYQLGTYDDHGAWVLDRRFRRHIPDSPQDDDTNAVVISPVRRKL